MGHNNESRSTVRQEPEYAVNSEYRESISFTFWGDPKQWRRVNYNAQWKTKVTPDDMALYQNNLRAQSLPHKPVMPFVGAIMLECKFYMRIPKSWSKKKKAVARTDLMPHVKNPDFSNLIKNVEDALTGVYYMDDRQIFCYGDSGKFYSEKPRVEITVTLIGKEI